MHAVAQDGFDLLPQALHDLVVAVGTAIVRVLHEERWVDELTRIEIEEAPEGLRVETNYPASSGELLSAMYFTLPAE